MEVVSDPKEDENDHKRNNFFFIGDALRALLTGGKVHFSSPSLASLKSFIECTDVAEG